MSNLAARIQSSNDALKPLVDFVVFQDGNGVESITFWKVGVAPKPEEFDSFAALADLNAMVELNKSKEAIQLLQKNSLTNEEILKVLVEFVAP